MTSSRLADASTEFAAAELGDHRLTRRLMRIADAAASAPCAGIPEIAGSDTELEGVYRFLRNGRVTPQKILAPHVAATQQRASDRPIVIAHDTTQLAFGGHVVREGLGRVGTSNCNQGFYAHFALAVAADEERTVLGVVGLKPFIRSWNGRTQPKHHLDKQPEILESRKWTDVALEVNDAFPRAIHVMDREADSYAVMSRLVEAHAHFVIRLCRDKRLDDSAHLLFRTAVVRGQLCATRSVPLSRRDRHTSRGDRRAHPPRPERTAKLEIRAAAITLPRPARSRYVAGYLPSLAVNVVTVQEVDAPPGEEPVCWRLVTTEPIDTSAQVEAIVDAYRARWRIEEFFKALKTGCAFEKRQLESLRTLVNALAVFSVIAWRLLLLRSVARASPQRSATTVLTKDQVLLLQKLSTTRPRGLPRVDMPAHPTVGHAMLAVAALGGHIKNNGSPGWMVLGRGYDALLLLEIGWQAGRYDR